MVLTQVVGGAVKAKRSMVGSAVAAEADSATAAIAIKKRFTSLS
jgi:hypothetical protein